MADNELPWPNGLIGSTRLTTTSLALVALYGLLVIPVALRAFQIWYFRVNRFASSHGFFLLTTFLLCAMRILSLLNPGNFEEVLTSTLPCIFLELPHLVYLFQWPVLVFYAHRLCVMEGGTYEEYENLGGEGQYLRRCGMWASLWRWQIASLVAFTATVVGSSVAYLVMYGCADPFHEHAYSAPLLVLVVAITLLLGLSLIACKELVDSARGSLIIEPRVIVCFISCTVILALRLGEFVFEILANDSIVDQVRRFHVHLTTGGATYLYPVGFAWLCFSEIVYVGIAFGLFRVKRCEPRERVLCCVLVTDGDDGGAYKFSLINNEKQKLMQPQRSDKKNPSQPTLDAYVARNADRRRELNNGRVPDPAPQPVAPIAPIAEEPKKRSKKKRAKQEGTETTVVEATTVSSSAAAPPSNAPKPPAPSPAATNAKPTATTTAPAAPAKPAPATETRRAQLFGALLDDDDEDDSDDSAPPKKPSAKPKPKPAEPETKPAAAAASAKKRAGLFASLLDADEEEDDEEDAPRKGGWKPRGKASTTKGKWGGSSSDSDADESVPLKRNSKQKKPAPAKEPEPEPEPEKPAKKGKPRPVAQEPEPEPEPVQEAQPEPVTKPPKRKQPAVEEVAVEETKAAPAESAVAVEDPPSVLPPVPPQVVQPTLPPPPPVSKPAVLPPPPVAAPLPLLPPPPVPPSRPVAPVPPPVHAQNRTDADEWGSDEEPAAQAPAVNLASVLPPPPPATLARLPPAPAGNESDEDW